MISVLKCWRPTYAQAIRNYAKSPKVSKPTKKVTEMKFLSVAEKNDAAKTISRLLSNGTARMREGYSVYNKIYEFDVPVKGRPSKMAMTSVSGHLLQLEFLASYRNWRNVEPSTLFEAPVRKTCSENFQPIKRTLEREIRGCAGLIIWTDCDREGENIGFEIIDVCRAIKPGIPVYRAVFSEITAAAVRRALATLQEPNQNQSNAVDVRTELDLRTGAAITRFQTMRLQRLFPEKIADKLISYGSCQIPTLGFVVERYKEVEAFVSEPFWKIKVIHTIEDLTVEFTWARNRLFDQQACEDYFLLCLADPKATVESVTVKPKSKWRPTAMDTVEMEKLGSRKLKLSAKETMTIAEKLYTKGIISYPRTETNQFSKEIDLRSLVEQQTGHGVWGSFAQRVVEWGPNPRNGNKSDQAHPPIHPTKLVTNLEGNEARVYELICRHFLACISKDAVGSETLVHIDIAGEKFTATGLVIYERNYLDVYIYDKWNAKQIHNYEQNQVFDPTEITMPEGATTAPPLLTEADLIALMDKHGIGTDATHAEHINTIKERGYIGVVDNGCLLPGVIGMGLYEGYDAMDLTLAKPNLRAEFEVDLKKICLGEKDPTIVLREQIQKYKEAYRQITEKVTAMDDKISHRLNETPAAPRNATDDAGGGGGSFNLENNANRIQELFECPKCGVASLALRQRKNQSGHYLGCLNYPDCKNAVWLPDDCKDASVLDETCQRCGAIKLLKFKFQSAYHKSSFNAPFGWYKTCLRCDSQFRNTFNINLESVKRVGGIVGANSAAVPLRTANNNHNAPINTPRNAPNWGSSGSAGVATSGSSRSTTTDKRTKKPSTKRPHNTDGTETASLPRTAPARKPAATKTKPKTTTVSNAATLNPNTNIRSYFTAAGSSSRTQTNEEIAVAELNNLPLDALFDSNDSFEDAILLAAEATNANEPTTARSSNNNNRCLIPTNELDADIAAAFADDDDDDLNWGSNATAAVAETSNSTNRQQTNNESFSAFFRNDDEFENYSWGTSGTNAATNQRSNVVNTPAPKRPCIQTTVDDEDVTTFAPASSWGSGTSAMAAATHNVRCNVCHQLAKQLTVKKDGPNKGREFFVCAKSNPCKFFQWLDEVLLDNATTNCQLSRSQAQRPVSNSTENSWGTQSSNLSTAGFSNDAVDTVKCGCGSSASSLTVRKEGPNKGRPFYSCSNRDKNCGFFKWGDEDDNQQASTSKGARGGQHSNASKSWGSGGHSDRPVNKKAASNQQHNAGGATKKRKCGLCRMEGHMKSKCPRKAQFEF